VKKMLMYKRFSLFMMTEYGSVSSPKGTTTMQSLCTVRRDELDEISILWKM